MAQPFEIGFQLTQHEIYQANVAIALRRYRALIAVLIMFAAITSSLYIATLGSGGSTFRDATLGTVLLTVVAPVFLIVTLFGSAHMAASQLARDTPSLRGTTLWSFSDAGILTNGPAGRTEFLWTMYFQARETETLFLLFPQPNIANVIPKRAFAGEKELAEFRALLADHGLPVK